MIGKINYSFHWYREFSFSKNFNFFYLIFYKKCKFQIFFFFYFLLLIYSRDSWGRTIFGLNFGNEDCVCVCYHQTLVIRCSRNFQFVILLFVSYVNASVYEAWKKKSLPTETHKSIFIHRQSFLFEYFNLFKLHYV